MLDALRASKGIALILPLVFGAVCAPTRWADRLAASNGQPVPPRPPADSPHIVATASAPSASAAEVADELRRFVASEVEPALTSLREHESRRGNTDTCFGSDAGLHLRARCCVFFSTLAAALLEERYGLPATADDTGGGAATSYALPPAGEVGRLYRALARWFLQPPPSAPAAAAALASRLIAAAGSSLSYGLSALGADAAKLPAPLGRYSSRLRVLGVDAVLERCEVSTVHTYLSLRSDELDDDVLIDVAFKQMLVVSDWMDERHYRACRDAALFDELADSFVGTPAQLGALMTAAALQSTMSVLYQSVGDDVGAAPFAQPAALQGMHELRNQALFSLGDASRRRGLCGRPTQAASISMARPPA